MQAWPPHNTENRASQGSEHTGQTPSESVTGQTLRLLISRKENAGSVDFIHSFTCLFVLHLEACIILVPRPGIEPRAGKIQSYLMDCQGISWLGFKTCSIFPHLIQ